MEHVCTLACLSPQLAASSWLLRCIIMSHGPDCALIKVGIADSPDIIFLHNGYKLQCEVQYETLAGWQSDISGIRTWEELPQAARDYVQRVEDLVSCAADERWCCW